jgi:hypothetical protein
MSNSPRRNKKHARLLVTVTQVKCRFPFARSTPKLEPVVERPAQKHKSPSQWTGLWMFWWLGLYRKMPGNPHEHWISVLGHD